MKTKLLFILLVSTLQIYGQNITTIGLGHNFGYATDIARDSNNNLYVVDQTNETIVKIDPNNKTEVISAGNGKPGAIVIDASNNLYVAYDSPGLNGGKVFKMNADGSNPVLFANPDIAIKKMKIIGIYIWFLSPAQSNKLGRIQLSNGTVGYTNSFAANIGSANDFTFDNQGNSYFAYPSTTYLLKMDNLFQSYSYTPSSGTSIKCVDYCPNLGLVIGGMSHVVLMGTSGDVITSYALPAINYGEAFMPDAIEARDFQNAHFIIFQNGIFKVFDFKYPDNFFTLRGSKFNTPIGIALDANNNNLYINDNDVTTGYNSIKKVNVNDSSFSNLYFTTNALGSLSQNNGLLYFADKTANEIKVMNTTGGSASAVHSGLSNPYLMKSFGSGEYITQRNSTSIKKLTFSFPGGYSSSNLGVTQDPKGFDFDSSGNIYVADSGFNTITKVLPTGLQSTIVSGLNKPSSVAISTAQGLIYFTDTENNAVKRMNLDGSNITTIGSGFYKPESVCLNSTNDKLYVTDTGNNLVKIIDLNTLSNSDFAKGPSFKIYPNPTNDFIHIQGIENQRISQAKIFDVNGRLVSISQNLQDNKLDVSQLFSGVYILKIETENGEANIRFIKN